ncbi:hypothetical protein J4N45_25200 [Vibrio sp. SCSIO 43140]|uniref:hypothetical protein n=1 Tax=Vibrio sp. SCSIO 43140 TaxID=2819100 RepID=UPI0020759E7B|nr:hypothetical protein [Vibrio sp. SCSIO 43140]USD62659.1 hypothetical protein J4N45_25200 [Vibrio sp. SCSIO 43140]
MNVKTKGAMGIEMAMASVVVCLSLKFSHMGWATLALLSYFFVWVPLLIFHCYAHRGVRYTVISLNTLLAVAANLLLIIAPLVFPDSGERKSQTLLQLWGVPIQTEMWVPAVMFFLAIAIDYWLHKKA